MITAPDVGSIVRCRDREWVVVPSSEKDLLLLRPLAGSDDELTGIYLPLVERGFDSFTTASFPNPRPEDSGDAVGVSLLYDAARLTLRDGAAPFRSLGRIGVRPRSYQFVPLMMALRLDPIRMLIADDVGVGKTVEALLIARELLDRGEISRFCVLCPPYLCDQWQKELLEKFSIDAVVIQAGTVGPLERELPEGDIHSVFSYYPFIVASIDYVKSDRRRETFIKDCPSLVIVDEAHGATSTTSSGKGQQQRHELLKKISGKQDRHLILLTATPHSGVEASFRSLLSLVKPEFGETDLLKAGEEERAVLARHFVQRRRADLKNWLNEETPFPDRVSEEVVYSLSPEYQELFKAVFAYSRDIVQTGETLSGWKRRVRYWTALALLRCVMSSPEAAVSTLRKAGTGAFASEEDEGDSESNDTYAPFVYEPTDSDSVDVQPSHIVQSGEDLLLPKEKGAISRFEKTALQLRGIKHDLKLAKCADIVHRFLDSGINPIIWCRYISTSDYVADELKEILKRQYPDIQVVSITGAIPDDERRTKIEEMREHDRRVLVATDCLSEGINLQDHFGGVIHYDLPWNPNRLEQREGRVDRFGQQAKEVRAVLLYGKDNPMDIAVLEVLLRKAREIRRVLGITVPVPMDSGSVMESVIRTLFFSTPSEKQLTITDFEEGVVPETEGTTVKEVHNRWDAAADREKESRTKFAQRAVKTDEVQRELIATDSVLGDPHAVRMFVINACQRFGVSLTPQKDKTFVITQTENLPEGVRQFLPEPTGRRGGIRIAFDSPAPEGVVVLGRNHPFVAGLGQFIFEEALARGPDAKASRCGVIRTNAVDRRTVICLFRGRFSVTYPEDPRPVLTEEVLVRGYTGMNAENATWISEDTTRDQLQSAQPNAPISSQERIEVLSEVLPVIEFLGPTIDMMMQDHAGRILEAHRRIRGSIKLTRRGLAVHSHLPPDLLGVLVLLPVVSGVMR